MASLAFLTPVIDLVFPPRCPLCGDALAQQGGLCAACWTKLAVPGEPACSTCQRPLADSMVRSGEVQCAPCMAEPPGHAGIAAATLYNDTSRELVLAFKRGKRIALADLLTRLMVRRLPDLEGEWLVIPVPLHRWRLWERGFNQSALLAERIAKTIRQPLVVDGLERRKRTPSLGGLGKRARAEALRGAITAHPRRADRLKGAKVLLVDDVMTSGATTDACLTALRKSGASEVRIACFARVLDEALDQAGRADAPLAA